MQTELSHQRLYKWDNLKCFLIVVVVIGHFLSGWRLHSQSADSLFLIIYTFHMPLFLFVSGLFSKSSIREDQLKPGKIFFFLFLYVLLAGITFLIKLFYGKKAGIELLGTFHVQWYLFAMAAFYCITYLLRKLNPGIVFVAAVLFACFAGYDRQIGNFLCMSKLVSFFPFFYAGYALNPQLVIRWLQKLPVKIISVIFLVGFLLFVFFNTKWYAEQFSPLFILSTPGVYRKLPNPDLGFLYRIAAYFITAAVSAAVISLTPNCKNPFSVIGQRTLQIYFWHVPLQMLYNLSGVGAFLASLMPAHQTILLLIVSLLVTLLFSLKFWGMPFTWLQRHLLRPNKAECISNKTA